MNRKHLGNTPDINCLKKSKLGIVIHRHIPVQLTINLEKDSE